MTSQPERHASITLPGLGRTRWLRRLAVLSWAGLALALGSLCIQQRLGLCYAVTWLWLPAGLASVVSGVFILLGGFRRAWLGPAQRRWGAWGGVGLLPLIAWATFTAMLVSGRGPAIAHKVGRLAATSLVPLLAEWRYAHRIETERLIMYYNEGVADPHADLAAMETHLTRLEQVLGRRQHAKIVWVRGPAILAEGTSINCVALGEGRAGAATNVDRHEVAHALLFQFTTPDADPPKLLVEGWARAVEGHPEPLAAAALRMSHQDLPLESFLGPEGYHRVWPWSYSYGGALVDHLLRRHGAALFLDLYNSCRPDTFQADFRRVYGRSFQEIEATFWQEMRSTGGARD